MENITVYRLSKWLVFVFSQLFALLGTLALLPHLSASNQWVLTTALLLFMVLSTVVTIKEAQKNGR